MRLPLAVWPTAESGQLESSSLDADLARLPSKEANNGPLSFAAREITDKPENTTYEHHRPDA
jgi:hypothetical protein